MQSVNFPPMDADDLFPKGVTDPLTTLGRQDLDPFSIEELNARIEALENEIARVKAKINAAVNHRASAEGLFKR